MGFFDPLPLFVRKLANCWSANFWYCLTPYPLLLWKTSYMDAPLGEFSFAANHRRHQFPSLSFFLRRRRATTQLIISRCLPVPMPRIFPLPNQPTDRPTHEPILSRRSFVRSFFHPQSSSYLAHDDQRLTLGVVTVDEMMIGNQS